MERILLGPLDLGTLHNDRKVWSKMFSRVFHETDVACIDHIVGNITAVNIIQIYNVHTAVDATPQAASVCERL